ncbi:hypothetical protein GGR53DRAFT_102855 [Hypoxylon sp. FL1150]|nr:hypothetical protein GGR53DRAFT_102855 [Hypoxylon sp. FL1150]
MIWSGLVFIIIFYTISVIVSLATCLPHPGDGGWPSLARGARCETENELFAEAQGIIGAITDLYVFFIPMTMFAKLRLSRKRRIGIYVPRACVVSIINAVFRFIVFASGDALWNEISIYALCAAELNFGIMCTCRPVVFILFEGLALETASWAAKLRSWTNRNEGDIEMQSYMAIDYRLLPQVPKGTLSGLKSFMRKAYHSSPGDIQLTLSPSTAGEVITYVSADDDYHSHLQRPGAGNSSRNSQASKRWELHRTYGPANV